MICDFQAVDRGERKYDTGMVRYSWEWLENRGEFEVSVYASSWNGEGRDAEFSWAVQFTGHADGRRSRATSSEGYAETVTGCRRSVSRAVNELTKWVEKLRSENQLEG